MISCSSVESTSLVSLENVRIRTATAGQSPGRLDGRTWPIRNLTTSSFDAGIPISYGTLQRLDARATTHRLLRYGNTTRSGQNFASLSASISTPRPGSWGIMSRPSSSRRNGSVVISSMYTQGVRYSM